MPKEIEIEFKNMLTKSEYEQLLSFFNFTREEAITQQNLYFDTAEFQLKEMESALRIRQKDNHYECTLKTPAPEGKLEITDSLTALQAKEMSEGISFPATEVNAFLEEKGVNWRTLRHIGTLTTHRIEFEYQQGLLVFDHSEYLGKEDYEVEYEVTDAAAGRRLFLEFLQQHNIPVRQADKKIARFMKAAEAGQ
ncbi:CYTH domain-containing protein [Planococcus salinus]|uniref:CYTH domain-containing protein n=1 Tax=Planococcus salinus TaxID=1848460 RepID=A0A3M8P4C6_9BACL|nr:CYTH domain-containing protein [Planococcus salinus]RNF38482.1 CYTH domain-containing protein [Planococcus salinus]